MATAPACQRASTDEVVVFAAASLTEAFADIETAFEAAHPGVDVRLNFAGSQVLATQIVEGAHADVFASANAAQIERAREAGRAGASQSFAVNRLVVATPTDDPADIGRVEDLARPGVRVVLASPAVPAGDYARQSLRRLGLEEGVLANVVSNEDSVRGVVSKLVLGEADAGLIYASDAEHATLRQLPLPAEAEVAVTYEIVALSDADHPTRAGELVDFVRTPGVAAILADHGLGAP